HFNGSRGIFHQYNVEFHRRLRLAQFFQMSQDASHRAPEVKPDDDDMPETKPPDDDLAEEEEEEEEEPCCQSDTVGIAVDYGAGQVRLTTAAAAALQEGIRSDAQRAKFAPATARYRAQPDVADEPAADHNGVRPGRRFTADDGRALFVGAREYALNEELERVYWKNLLFQPPMYGADVLGSLFPAEAAFAAWNMRRLPGLLRLIGQRMPGVNDPYLYLGMWKATFAWHVEDMDLYSINYIHFGAPKAWYAVPVDAHGRFEMSMQNVFANDHKACAQFLRHKAFLLSPRFLAQQGIPFHRVVQRAGEIMLTFPHGYHAGFNHGFNCAESVNFALDRWLDVAWDSKHCECVKDSVTIDLMRWFGDVNRERLARSSQRQRTASAGGGGDDDSPRAVRVSPRRHAAAAAAPAKAPGSNSSNGGSSSGLKRKPSSAASPEAVQKAQRSPKRTVAAAPPPPPPPPGQRKAEDSVDVARRYASLHTPVGTCGGCLQAIASIAKAIECVQCGLTVHPQCAGLAVDDGTYKCANCVMDTDQLSCTLCAFQNGVLLPLKRPYPMGAGAGGGGGGGSRSKSLFAHFLCATFVPQTFFEFPPLVGSVDHRGGRMAPPSPGLVTKEMVAAVKTSAATSATSATSASVPDVPVVKEDVVSTRSRTAAAAAAAAAVAGGGQTPSVAHGQSFAGPTRCWARVCGVPPAASALAPTKPAMAMAAANCVICCPGNNVESGGPGGVTVACGDPGCANVVHPMCAATYRLYPSLLDWNLRK
ncbi:hypothetical protein GGF44_002052, partial [Coemansia sp. RSA 1694]